jgi:DNA repair exonuclease SbcCD ATPase subunit
MLLFGGTLQCYPLRNPYQPATDPQQIVHAAATLFARALGVWNASVTGTQEPSELAQAAASLAGQLAADITQVADQTRAKWKAAEEALAELQQITLRQRELESRRAQAEQAAEAPRKRVAALRADLAALEKQFAESTEEEQRLSLQLADFRSRVKPIRKLRSECAALGEEVERGERELTELQQKRNAALRQRHELERKLNDTRELMQQIKTQLDASVAQKIQRIWEQLPPGRVRRADAASLIRRECFKTPPVPLAIKLDTSMRDIPNVSAKKTARQKVIWIRDPVFRIC